MPEKILGILLTAMGLAIVVGGLWMLRATEPARAIALRPAISATPLPASPARPAPNIRATDLATIHEKHTLRFERAAGFGGGRMGDFLDEYWADMEGPIAEPKKQKFRGATWPELQRIGEWNVRRVELMGRIDAAPVVYPSLRSTAAAMSQASTIEERVEALLKHSDTADEPWMKTISVRESITQEIGFLKELKDGRPLAWRATADGAVLAGALRAHGKCLNCHDVKEDQLLGALVYELEWAPTPPAK